MRFGNAIVFSALLLTSALPSQASPRLRRGPTSPKMFGKRGGSAPRQKPVSQRVIDPERTTQIQTALIKQGYMTGEPTGKWDASTQAALEKMQGDNGWQTKMVPDSRAIIKLGLGPGSSPAAGEASVQPAVASSAATTFASDSGTLTETK